MDCKIRKVKAREILDSRGNPTVEAEIFTKNFSASASVASGASTGMYEALELRDNEKRYSGMGVLKAVSNINNIIAKKIAGMDCREQKEIDSLMIELDETKNKSMLGANATTALSMAVCRLGAICSNMLLFEYITHISNSKATLPVPQFNVINGGAHAGVDNDIQEHMIMPVGAKSFSEALRMGAEIYHTLKDMLKKKFGASAILLGDEGGFVPPLKSVEDRLKIINEAIKKAGYEKEIKLALDCAASEFFKDDKYTIIKNKYSSSKLTGFYKKLVKNYDVVSIEDGMAENDWDGWKELTKKLGDKTQIVGDDLLVTNTKKIKKAIVEKAVNSVLIKVNQIGTVSETLDAIRLAKDNGWSTVVSNRSGETEDSFIADLVVGVGSGQCKFGAPARSERNCKYNQLLRIEEDLGSRAKYYKFSR